MSQQSQRSMHTQIWQASLQRLRAEQGSSLILVMFVILLLTILGLSVLSAAVGGAQRTETRENDVQSLHLAEKTLDEGVAYITANLNGLVDRSADMSKDQLEDSIQVFLDTLNDKKSGLMTTTTLEGGSSRIMDAEWEIPDPAKPNQYQITLTSQADLNGVQRNLKQVIYVDTFPDFLNYTLGSEGDLTINGSPEINGNIYAGGQLIFDKQVKYMYGGVPNTYTSQSYAVLNGEAHVQSLNNVVYYYTDDRKPLTAGQAEGVTGTIPQNQVKIRSQRKFVQVNVKESFIDKVVEAMEDSNARPDRQLIRAALDNGGLAAYLKNKDFKELTESNLIRPVLTDNTEAGKAKYEVDKTNYLGLLDSLGSLRESVIYDGNLTLNDQDVSKIIYESKEDSSGKHWFIVDGDLNIESFNSNIPAKIKANMLVTGKVTIRGVAEFDSTVYVLEEDSDSSNYSTTVEDADITGLGGRQLVLLSQGPILFNRLTAFKGSVTPIAAFFYTDSSAELYGVGSIFSLRGGFFAKENLTIYAVRGEALAGTGQINVTENPNLVRFKAEYDNTVFSAQNAGLPRVKAINIRVGDLELE
ncbi:hypothetical protein PaeBR_21895 [Paenibacillus sp. BR2-3]|uniref:hypothetical protein n=1 Tax=Paenibacillus sp. BR2-3 TaxID=3048494 RepID=UPI0039773D30